MAELQQGSSYTGPPYPEAEFFNVAGMLTLANNATIYDGDVLCRDLTQISSGASWSLTAAENLNQTTDGPQTDMLVPASSANAGKPFMILGIGNALAPQGITVAQVTDAAGNKITTWENTSGVTMTFIVNGRRWGYGSVTVQTTHTGATVHVGDNLIANTGTGSHVIQGAATLTKNVGIALASLATVAKNAILLPIPVSGTSVLKINADIHLE